MLEPAGLGLLLGVEGASLSLSLQGGAGDDDDSERERIHRIFSRRRAGGAREEEGSRAGCARQSRLRQSNPALITSHERLFKRKSL